MKDYQQRVCDEKDELQTRLLALGEFIDAPGNSVFELLPLAEKRRLIVQETVMKMYRDVLSDRIEAFE